MTSGRYGFPQRLLASVLGTGGLLMLLSGCDGAQMRESSNAFGSEVEGIRTGYQRVIPAGTMEVVDVAMGRRVGRNMRIAEESTLFQPHDPIYLVVITEGGEPGGRLVVRWRTREGEVLGRETEWVPPGRQYLEFSPPGREGRPLGSYTVDLILDGDPVATADFEIVGDVARGWLATGAVRPGEPPEGLR